MYRQTLEITWVWSETPAIKQYHNKASQMNILVSSAYKNQIYPVFSAGSSMMFRKNIRALIKTSFVAEVS